MTNVGACAILKEQGRWYRVQKGAKVEILEAMSVEDVCQDIRDDLKKIEARSKEVTPEVWVRIRKDLWDLNIGTSTILVRTQLTRAAKESI